VVGKELPFQGLIPWMLTPAWGTNVFPTRQLGCTQARISNDLRFCLIAPIMGAESKNPGGFLFVIVSICGHPLNKA